MTDRESRPAHHRPIRSFVLRTGRLTEGQSKALAGLWPKYGINSEPGLIDPGVLFGGQAPLVVEIGFGNGEATWRMAEAEAGKNFIGIEVHKPGVGHLLQMLEARQLPNVRIASCDAVEFLRDRLPRAAVSELRIYFPDPWPKKRHHKRRIIQPEFLDLLSTRIRPGGLLHLATDWQPYAEHMLEVLSAHAAFQNCSGINRYSDKPDWRPDTKYEARGARLGHRSFDLIFCVRANPADAGNQSSAH